MVYLRGTFGLSSRPKWTSEFPSSLQPRFRVLPPVLGLPGEELASGTNMCGHVMGRSKTVGPQGRPWLRGSSCKERFTRGEQRSAAHESTRPILTSQISSPCWDYLGACLFLWWQLQLWGFEGSRRISQDVRLIDCMVFIRLMYVQQR